MNNTRLNLDPTLARVVLIALLLFSEAVAINVYSVMQQGRFPSGLEISTFAIGAVAQLITFVLTFLETGTTPTPVTPETKPTP